MQEELVMFTTKLPKEVVDWLTDFQARTGITKKRIVEKALLYYKRNFDNEDLNIPF